MRETLRGALLSVLFFALLWGGVAPTAASDDAAAPAAQVDEPQAANVPAEAAKVCKPRPVGLALTADPPFPPGPDPCAWCHVSCLEEWQDCRAGCSGVSTCQSECAADLEWCVTTGCYPHCDEAAVSEEERQKAEAQVSQSVAGTEIGLRTSERTPEVSSRTPAATW